MADPEAKKSYLNLGTGTTAKGIESMSVAALGRQNTSNVLMSAEIGSMLHFALQAPLATDSVRQEATMQSCGSHELSPV